MKLEVTRGIECGERVCGDESGHCRVRGEWDGGDGCGSNRLNWGWMWRWEWLWWRWMWR